MTQPTTINHTFDTSLIDTQQLINRSFSSTETNTSGSSNNLNITNTRPSHTDDSSMADSQPFTTVTNDQLYDNWARTYDTDGNVLQAVDDLELEVLLPEFVRLIRQDIAPTLEARPCRILDFGCGTGRNTAKLLQANWHDGDGEIEIHGWDGSQAMLEIARQKCGARRPPRNVKLANILQMDFSNPSVIPVEHVGSFAGIISTLVLEHLPLSTFFTSIANLLAPGGYALVTNMHPEMGRTTKAGYKTTSGERVKGESYVHGVEESVSAAEAAGLEVVERVGVRERPVDEQMVQSGQVGERGTKWVGTKVWCGFILKNQDSVQR
jgi:SAM-dependent methyltransferase